MRLWASDRSALRGQRLRRRLGLVLCWILMAVGSVTMLVPLLWMIQVSLGTEGTLVTRVAPWRLADWNFGALQWGNYRDALTEQPFHLYTVNTMLITFFGLMGDVAASSLVAYGFARLRFRGRGPLFVLVLSTMMIPAQVTIVPTFILFRTLGWIDTLKPLIVPAFFGSAFSIFLFRQFFTTIPRDLDEAALIDGCSRFQIYAQVILPLSKPVIMTVVIFGFLTRWNDFFGPLIYINSDRLFTLSLGLANYQGLFASQWHLLMAASLVVMLPCIALFFLAQRHFIEGVVVTGLKG
jgi:ABC-type glycerol-3-phosphate transport system permease component